MLSQTLLTLKLVFETKRKDPKAKEKSKYAAARDEFPIKPPPAPPVPLT